MERFFTFKNTFSGLIFYVFGVAMDVICVTTLYFQFSLTFFAIFIVSLVVLSVFLFEFFFLAVSVVVKFYILVILTSGS